MKKIFPFLISFITICCYPQKVPTPKKPVIEPVSKINYKTTCSDSGINLKKIDNWYNEKYTSSANSYYDFSKSKNLKTVKQQYVLKNNILFNNGEKIDCILIFYRQSDDVEYRVDIVNGVLTGYIIEAYNNPRPSMYSVFYDEDGNIRYNYIENQIYLPKGNGILKSYFFSKWNGKNQSFDKETLKEEGEVKNNFKFGEWKYYNKEGKIDSIKTYTLKDSVDVRFPHCIFNKIEPCY